MSALETLLCAEDSMHFNRWLPVTCLLLSLQACSEQDAFIPGPENPPSDPSRTAYVTVIMVTESGKTVGEQRFYWSVEHERWVPESWNDHWLPGFGSGTEATPMIVAPPSQLRGALLGPPAAHRGLFAGGVGRNGANAQDSAAEVNWTTGVVYRSAMTIARSDHTMTELADGRVLVVGGTTANATGTATAELYLPVAHGFAATGSMAQPRFLHAAARLPDGRVLVTGGGGDVDEELYDPSTGTFSAAGRMQQTRNAHAAVTLNDGRILLVGGNGRSSAEVYQPSNSSYALVGAMAVVHGRGLRATLLADGKVLVTGGVEAGSSPTAVAELFDPATNQFTRVANLHAARYGHWAARLGDGTVMIGGGTGADGAPMASVERYDPTTRTFGTVDPMPEVGTHQAAVLLDQ